MVKSKHTICLLLLYGIVVLSTHVSAAYTHLLWERSISTALNNRDDFYQTVGITHEEATFNMLWTSKGRLALQEQLELNIYPDIPWYHFLLGIVNCQISINVAVKNFNTAIRCAESDPGSMWVLFNEFRQAKQEDWADKCLRNLEREFISSSALSAPVISQQLLAIAKQEHQRGNPENAEKYIAWSSRFERYPFWQTVYKGVYSFPQKTTDLIQAVIKCIAMIKNSWLLQLTLFNYIYHWFRFICIAFICMVLLTLSLETMPVALHPVLEFFPAGITSRLRYLLSIALLLSLSVFGFIPFTLLVSLLLWRHVKGQKRILLLISLVLITLSPMDARIQEMFRMTLSPDQSLGIFRRAISEGWHIDIEKRVQENLKTNHDDYLAYTSAAILGLKKNDMQSATSYIKKAEEIAPTDPVVLITAGNIYFSAGNEQRAQSYYTKCIEHFPTDATALFNSGQLNLNLLNTAEGTQQLAKAAELQPEMVNTFIEKNADFFSDNWPRLRQFQQPDYSASYFWKKVFPAYTGSWESTGVLWGATLFGIPPLVFLCIAPVLLLILLTAKKVHPVEKIFFCKLCGNPMCRKCRVGLLCTDCIQATDEVRNETLNKHVTRQILRHKEFIRLLTSNILRGLFPGTEKIYKRTSFKVSGILLLVSTCMIFGSYGSLLTVTFSYPFWIIQKLFIALICCLLVYNITVVTRAIINLIKELKSVGEIHGSQRQSSRL